LCFLAFFCSYYHVGSGIEAVKESKIVKIVLNNKITWTIVSAIAAVSMTSAVQAEYISGTISMQGLANLADANGNAASISAATEVQFVPGFVLVGADSGAFATVPLYSSVSMGTPWVFNPSTPMPGLWSVTGNDGYTFNFDASSDSFTQSGDFLNIIGAGTISSSNPNYDPTSFDWSISFENSPSGGPVEFNFSAFTVGTQSQTVPDGGLTVAFLGLALASVECFRRKFSKI
jgi:hypothetical protein